MHGKEEIKEKGSLRYDIKNGTRPIIRRKLKKSTIRHSQGSH